jgi:hypothetical protein
MALAELHLVVVGILGSSPFAYAKTGRFSVCFFVREQDELHSAAQARAWADGDFDADHGLGLDGVRAGPDIIVG